MRRTSSRFATRPPKTLITPALFSQPPNPIEVSTTLPAKCRDAPGGTPWGVSDCGVTLQTSQAFRG